eukprot:Gregarina_sp_Poly_1__4918@NODE_2609_length_1924_cov_6_942380_g1653_i0_p1_GENE_NODE_2609_length_1924_cov_6_942380_g1653_i0NODE_2609_length_1924_cov_6_942380_g1653_i0_p1_ORF_typecomplete_len446_score50_49YppG/PF14179_6/0_21YppG/PF14179_6/3_1e03_NODE_2609_length_1924_cov_6_942380_g1653_i01761513
MRSPVAAQATPALNGVPFVMAVAAGSILGAIESADSSGGAILETNPRESKFVECCQWLDQQLKTAVPRLGRSTEGRQNFGTTHEALVPHRDTSGATQDPHCPETLSNDAYEFGTAGSSNLNRFSTPHSEPDLPMFMEPPVYSEPRKARQPPQPTARLSKYAPPEYMNSEEYFAAAERAKSNMSTFVSSTGDTDFEKLKQVPTAEARLSKGSAQDDEIMEEFPEVRALGSKAVVQTFEEYAGWSKPRPPPTPAKPTGLSLIMSPEDTQEYAVPQKPSPAARHSRPNSAIFPDFDSYPGTKQSEAPKAAPRSCVKTKHSDPQENSRSGAHQTDDSDAMDMPEDLENLTLWAERILERLNSPRLRDDAECEEERGTAGNAVLSNLFDVKGRSSLSETREAPCQRGSRCNAELQDVDSAKNGSVGADKFRRASEVKTKRNWKQKLACWR